MKRCNTVYEVTIL